MTSGRGKQPRSMNVSGSGAQQGSLGAMDRILDKIKLDAWLELNYDLTSYEQIKILNYILFDVHKFRGNTTDYHHIDNSLIHKVLTEKTGNPVSISIVYAIIAQRLNIPVYGVNLPQHFVLGYKSSEGIELLKRFNDPSTIKSNQKGDILFWKGHVAMCLNSKQLIHAYGPEKKVLIMPILKTIKRIENTAKLKVKKIAKIKI